MNRFENNSIPSDVGQWARQQVDDGLADVVHLTPVGTDDFIFNRRGEIPTQIYAPNKLQKGVDIPLNMPVGAPFVLDDRQLTARAREAMYPILPFQHIGDGYGAQVVIGGDGQVYTIPVRNNEMAFNLMTPRRASEYYHALGITGKDELAEGVAMMVLEIARKQTAEASAMMWLRNMVGEVLDNPRGARFKFNIVQPDVSYTTRRDESNSHEDSDSYTTGQGREESVMTNSTRDAHANSREVTMFQKGGSMTFEMEVKPAPPKMPTATVRIGFSRGGIFGKKGSQTTFDVPLNIAILMQADAYARGDDCDVTPNPS